MRNPRAVLAGATAAVAVAVAGALILVGGGGGDDGAQEDDRPPAVVRASLTLEQATRADTGGRELIVSLANPQLNTPETTGGETVVNLECLDGEGDVVLAGPATWPLLEEPGFPPHIHQPVPAGSRPSDVRSCRLSGPGIDFDGSVSGPPPTAG